MPASPESNQILTWMFGVSSVVFTTIISWLTHDRNKARKQLEDNTQDITRLKEKIVTEDRVREILQETLNPISIQLSDIKNGLNDFRHEITALKISQAEERARREAVNEMLKRSKEDD